MLLLSKNIAEFVIVEMLDNCNYQSVLSLRFSFSDYLRNGGRKVKLTLFTSMPFTCFKGMIDGVSEKNFVAINLLILS
jgi:hypothetical protein